MPHGGSVQDWVKKLPSRRFDRSEKVWYITGTGIHPDKFFAKHGIDVDYSEASGALAGLDSLASLWRPTVKRSRKMPHRALVKHRLAGYERVGGLLGPGAVWDKKLNGFVVQLSDLVADGARKRGLIMDDDTEAAALDSLQRAPIPGQVRLAARELGQSTGVEADQVEQKVVSARTQELIDIVADHTGYLPDWFGLELYPFQLAGAYAIAGGHRALCDAPGLGKTRQALAAAAIHGAERVVIVVPPLVVTNWCREAAAALGGHYAGDPIPPMPKTRGKARPAEFPHYIVPVRAGRKVPPFPTRGVIVVADSLLASRPQLLADLIAWAPTEALFDEVHRARTWGGVRATADRNLACSTDGLRIPMTGTPFLANPVEGTNMLAIGGVLDSRFGGPSKFIDRYATQNHFGAWLPNRKMLGDLEDRLTKYCWVRRNKADVLKQLPKKLRTIQVVDIDPRGFKAAHDTLYEKVSEWLDEFTSENGYAPAEEDIKTFARTRIDLITPLRAAAGIAKIPAAIQIVTDWMEQTTETGPGGRKTYTRPLTVWVHHTDVMEALVEAIPKDLAGVGFIDGSTPGPKRQLVADQLQNGEIGVIFCSIGAAGFGITLTKSSDVIFVETDWTPANISQAEDRCNRIGSTETCIVTTLVAADTLDPHMRAILKNKGKDLNVIMPGADNNVTETTVVLNTDDGVYEEFYGEDAELEKQFKSLADIVERIVLEVMAGQKMRIAA
ncbi:DEAD/DEAH box helicase [Arthrobacter sp. A2-55]|uniref:helicase-related protein n=1 Tax=Arthrobacter sp. A2-55 TaxID=2897337 RepID=UPI0021CDE0CF|nr:DEAD/DEAH box helicase [Arthrobacter sp. A2-55]MCU6479098.1 DEAD/DEAH box helicase [Arthrobacter sp. A2-55]